MNGEIIGSRLRAAREAQNLSLEQISRATYIRVHYLHSMEAGQFDNLPSQTQARGFLRSVASYLKIDPEPLLAELDQPVGSTLPRSLMDSSIRKNPSAIPGAEETETLPTEVPEVLFRTFRETGDLPVNPPLSAQPAEVQAIYKGIGSQLQTRRELLGLTIEDVERHTRLRSHYIRALESGEIERLPSSVQGRGMLNNYASFLGIDPEPLLLRFAEGLQTSLALRQGRPLSSEVPFRGQAGGDADASSSSNPQSTPPTRRIAPFGSTFPLRRFFSLELLFVGLTALALIAFAIWGGLRITEMLNPDQTVPTAPSIVEVLLATETPQPTLTLTPTPANLPGPAGQPGLDATEISQQSISSGSNVQLYLTIYQRALLKIIVDGEPQFAGRVLPGTAYTFSGKDQIELTTSNGAAIQVFFNGEDQGLLGLFGQVVYRIYTTQGIITPTPTITLTPTPTQVPTATPEPTRTISPNLPEAPTVPALP